MNKIIRTIFDEWTETSTYLFGFWLADGSIKLHKAHGSIFKCFIIYNTDKQIMDDISIILNAKLGIYNRINWHNYPKNKVQYYVWIYSDKMFDFCYKYTNSTRKSNKEIPFPEIPKIYFHHFIRGFFDGDGSIHIKHYKNSCGKITEALQTSFTAGKDTGDFLHHLKEQLRLFIPIGNKKICGKISKKLIFNQYDSMLLCEWMYKDATIFMKRKKDIWDATDKERLLKSKKYFSNKV